MKTPRLALFAFLALAPAANAEMPAWTVVDESFRSWPTIDFKVGSESKSLRCRLSECDPSKKKGQSNLFVLTQTGALEPIDATIYKLVPRAKYNPRYYTDGPYEKVPEVVKSHRTRYTTTLSNFKLDNSGAALVVVQGTNKYPATTDINRVYVSATGSVIAVAPPTTMADDVVKPASNPTGPGAEPRRGRPRRGGPRKEPTSPATTPVVAGEAVLMITDRERNWLTKKQAKELDLDLKDALTKPAAARGAAQKSTIEKYRALIKAQIRPESAAGYAAAIAAPKSAKEVDDALPKKLWGGDVSSVVASSGTNLEIQLSPEEYEALKKKPDDLKAYEAARGGADGDKGDLGQGVFDKDSYDPIQLHLAVEAARKALAATPTAPVVGPKPEDGKLLPLLTEDQKKFLTPKEIANYEAILLAAPEPKNADKNVQALLKTLLAKIEARKAEPYPEGGLTEATFDKAPAWQKDKFCDPKKVGVAAASTTEAKLDFDPKAGTLTDLQRIEAEKVAAQKKAAAEAGKPLPPWAVDKCKGSPFYTEPATSGATNPDSGIGNLGGPKKTGPDANPKEKEPNTWITRPLLQTGAKGALIGILIGSLFGPVGLIAGPLIGAAFFYGLKKYDDAKAKKAE